MSLRKRLTAFAAASALFITLLPASVFAHDGEHKIYKGSFSYYDDTTKSDRNADFYFSDAYFSRPSTQMDEHLRTMSLCLSIASIDKDKSGSVYDVLEKTGFDSDTVQADEMTNKTKDTIGTIMANKTTDDGSKLVVVAVNGIFYDAEWESNLTVGKSGDAEGFAAAAKKTYDRIVKYESDNDLKGAKLWITGFSRGGAVADMTGKLINENLETLGITESDLYDYAFAVPRASEKAIGYKNIHDIIDPYDIIPRLMPQGWGIERAGTEYLIPCEKQTVPPKQFDILGGLKIKDKTETKQDPETGKYEQVPCDPIEADTFLDTFLKLLSDNVTRESFDAERDSVPQFVTKLLVDKGDYTIINLLSDSFKGFGISSPLFMPVFTLLTYPIDSDTYKQTMEDLPKLFSDFLDASENKDKISAEDLELTKKAVPALVRIFAPAIKADMANTFETIATLFGNISQIISNHYPSNYFKKVSALDSFYTEKKDVDPGKLTYFSKEFTKGEYEEMAKLGIPQSDLDLIKNGYDVSYITKYDVFENSDVSSTDKAAVAKLLGRDPDLAIYFTSTPTRTQTFGETQEVELEEGYMLKLTVVPGEDEEVGTNGEFCLVSYKDGKAEKCEATFEFNDKGQLTMVYPYQKDTCHAIVYLENKPAESMRIWGSNRYETSRKAADRFKKDNNLDKFPALVIATGTDYADALSAAYLAKVKNAPIILTNNQTATERATLDYIHANCNKNTKIYIVGGDGVISYSFEKKLTSMAPIEQQYDVKRLAGENRYLTNIEILKEAGVKSEELIIASGLDYADALSASAAAKPVLLTAKKLTAEQEEFIKTLSVEKATIVGGTGAVNEKVESSVKALIKNVDRIGGKTRFETSKMIAEKYFDKPQAVALAYALQFPDGLVAAPLAMTYNCPILLVTDKNYSAAAEYAKAAGAAKTVTFGGTAVISDDTVKGIVPEKA